MRFKYKKMIITASCSIMFLGMVVFSGKSSAGTNVTDQPKAVTDKAVATVSSNTAIASSKSSDLDVKSAKDIASGNVAETENTENNGNTEKAENSKNNENTDNAKGISILMKNAYPEVNNLVAEYLKARVAVDKDKMSQLVDDMNYAGIEELKLMMKNIEDIKLTDCYTIDGPEDKAVMVYARTEIKFKGIDTAASGLDGFYVRPDDNGDFKIVLSPITNEVQKIIDEDTKREDVAALLSDVNTKLAHEIKSDKKLAELYAKLQNRQAGSDEEIKISGSEDEEGSKKSDKKNSSKKKKKSKKKTKEDS